MKQNPLLEYTNTEELTNDFNLFLKSKVDKINESFSVNVDCDGAFEHDYFCWAVYQSVQASYRGRSQAMYSGSSPAGRKNSESFTKHWNFPRSF